MKPGHGEVLLAEGDPRVREDEERLVEEFRRQLDEGMWAAVPITEPRQRPARGTDGQGLLATSRTAPSGSSSSRARRAAEPDPRMLLALLVLALVAVVLAAPIAGCRASRAGARAGARAGRRARATLDLPLYDPGRERRAERRARELLRSCVNAEEWGMYRDLGFIRVAGATRAASRPRAAAPPTPTSIYPHKPIVAYLPGPGSLLSEYCVEFPDLSGAAAGPGCPPPTTCSPSGWRSPPTRTA